MPRLTRAAKDKILSFARACVGEGIDNCEDKHRRAEENQQYVRGVQWSAADLERQERRERPSAPLNDTFKVVHAISNKELVSRLVPKVNGRTSRDEGMANILDDLCRWQREQSSSEQYESMGFRSAVMSGYGCVHKYWDPTANEGDGQILDKDVPIWEMLWPARSREMNLTDRRWHIRGRWISEQEAEELYGASNPAVRKALKKGSLLAKSSAGIADTSNVGDYSRKSSANGFGWEMVRSGTFQNFASNEVFVLEQEWLETNTVWKAAVPKNWNLWVNFVGGQIDLPAPPPDPQSGEAPQPPLNKAAYDQLPREDQDGIRESILAESEWVTYKEISDLNEFRDLYDEIMGETFEYFDRISSREVKFAVIVANEVAETGTRPWGWSYHFITGFPFENQDGMDFHGVVDIVKGPQDYKNALASSMLAMYMASPKGALIIEKGMVTPNLADQLASPSGLVVVNDGFFAAKRSEFAAGANYPPTLEPLMEVMNNGVLSPLGLSSIDLGTQTDLRRLSSKTAQAASLAANVIVAIPFDAMRMFRRAYGKCNAKFLQYMYSPEQIVEIVGEDKAVDMPQDPAAWERAFKYEIAIDEQPSSTTEMMEVLEKLTVTGELTQMRNRGDIQRDDYIELLPIPKSLKRSIMKNNGVADQAMAVTQENQGLKGEIQQMYQFFNQSPEGRDMLSGFVSQYQNNQFSQQNFSQPGVPPPEAGGSPQQ